MNSSVDKSLTKEHLSYLAELADLLLLKQPAKSGAPLIVSLIGAGASSSAGLPNNWKLQRQIYEAILQQGPSGVLAKVLDAEAKFLFPVEARDGILQLSPFQFAAVISRFAYAREKIRSLIKSVMTDAKSRPLVYELLAHLAKHGFIDHFISLNFDELLDEALDDELPDRLRLIISPDEIPGPEGIHDAGRDYCYLIKPFGSISKDTYKLKPDDILHYGSESVWRFILENIFQSLTGDTRPSIVLIIIGYAAAEPAFEQLMTELLNDRERQVTTFLIDPRDDLPDSLERFKNSQNFELKHINLKADTAFNLLLKIMKLKYTSGDYKTWIPVARHRVISALPYRYVAIPANRFKVELILQAIKSRGFFTVEAVAQIGRIRKYSEGAYKLIEEMRNDGILSDRPSSSDKAVFGPIHLRQDYTLKHFDNNVLSAKLLEIFSLNPIDKIDEWQVKRQGDTYTAKCKKVSYLEFFKTRFDEIVNAPEIEVSEDASPATNWMFSDARRMNSITELTETTAQLFKKVLKEARGTMGEHPVRLRGIWTTGEWLFHQDGWAWKEIGEQLVDLISRGQVKLELVLAENPENLPIQTLRYQRSKDIWKKLIKLKEKKSCDMLPLKWWRHNRILTLLSWETALGHQREGIYMRRRVATPLVAPIHVSGEDCIVLDNIFERYWDKALSIQQTELNKKLM